jgi:hypothetical protein
MRFPFVFGEEQSKRMCSGIFGTEMALTVVPFMTGFSLDAALGAAKQYLPLAK